MKINKLKPIFKRLFKNAFFWATIIFLAWFLFLSRYNIFYQKNINEEYKSAKDEKEFYLKEIAQDSTQIEKLKDTNEMERYAREKFLMKKENEVIFVIEEIK